MGLRRNASALGRSRFPLAPTRPIPLERRLFEPARDRVTRRKEDRTPIQEETRRTDSNSAWFFRLHQNVSKTQQPKDLQGWQGRRELSRTKLGDVEPLLHRLCLHPTVSFEQFGKVAHRQLTLFLTDDFHNIRGDVWKVLSAPGFVKRERATREHTTTKAHQSNNRLPWGVECNVL